MRGYPFRSAPSRRIVVFGLLTLAYSLAFLHRMSPTAAADDIMRDFDASATLMGLLASAYFYPYALMQVPCGILADRLGARRLVGLALAVAALGGALFALAAGPAPAFAGRVGVGLGLALVLVPANKALAAWYAPRDFVLAASSLLAGATGLGVMLSGAPLAALIQRFGWRPCFFGMSVLTLLVGAAVGLFVRDAPPGRELRPGDGPKSAAGTPPPDAVPVREALRRVLTCRDYWMVGLVFLLTSSIFFSFNGLWVGPFLTEAGGLSRAVMGTAVSVSGLASAAAPVLFAAVARRVGDRRTMIVAAALLTLATVLWGALRNGRWGAAEMCLWTGCLAFLCTAPPGLYFTTVKELFPPSMAGTATGLVYALPMLGSAVYQPLVGRLLDLSRSGPGLDAGAFQPVLWLFCASAGCALACALGMTRRTAGPPGRRKEKRDRRPARPGRPPSATDAAAGVASLERRSEGAAGLPPAARE